MPFLTKYFFPPISVRVEVLEDEIEFESDEFENAEIGKKIFFFDAKYV